MSTEANPSLTGLLILVPIILTIAIAIGVVKCTDFQLSKALELLGKHHRRSQCSSDSTEATPVDIELGNKECSAPAKADHAIRD